MTETPTIGAVEVAVSGDQDHVEPVPAELPQFLRCGGQKHGSFAPCLQVWPLNDFRDEQTEQNGERGHEVQEPAEEAVRDAYGCRLTGDPELQQTESRSA